MKTFHNPIIPGFYPDPTICRSGDDYYVATSSMGYFPGVPVFHSRDLVYWRQISYALNRPEQLCLDGADVSHGGIFAPTLRYSQGRFYLVTTNINHGGNFIVTTEDPAGPWSSPVWLDPAAEGGIDPSLFFDDDGSVYFTGTREGRIRQFRINPTTGQRLEEPYEVWSGTGGQYPEAPHLFRIGETYHLTLAEGGTEYGHMQTIARAPSPHGPWEGCPRNPILTHRSRSSQFHAVGHGDFVQSPNGRWWMVFHAIRPLSYPPFHTIGRETCLAPVEWDAEGWPVVNHGELIAAEMPGTGIEVTEWPDEPARDDFDSISLALPWCHIRNPIEANYVLNERPGHLGLVASEDSIGGAGRPTFVGRRQRSHRCSVSAAFDFRDLVEGEESGLVVFQNERHHYEIAARLCAGGLEVFVRRRIGDLEAEVASVLIAALEVVLGIEAAPDLYTFWVSSDTEPRKEIATGASRYLGTEIAGGFNGCFLGMYAHATLARPQPCAWVDWFELTS